MEYVKVVIDNSNDKTDRLYTYGTEITGLKAGDKVSVPFARGNRIRDAYVHTVIDKPDIDIKDLKFVISKNEELSLSPSVIQVSNWMRERYFCRYIDAIKCFAPPGNPPKKKIQEPINDERDFIPEKLPELTDEQASVLMGIKGAIDENIHRVFLIHGVTSSGKTEVYMRAAAECIKQGKAVIMLVPEISLTTQTIERFLSRFGSDKIAVLHSKLTRVQRYNEWLRVKQGKVKIVIGARSAVFAPFDNIGAIIIDEEHETTYKSDMTPKYDTVEVAIQRSRESKAVVILGSATPSLISTYKSESGSYERLLMTRRYNEAPLPSVKVVDMREELKNGNKSIFSLELYHQIERCLEDKRQVILFLNRRGYSTFLSCRYCGYVMRCDECSISLTFHKSRNEVVCHFCGNRKKVPRTCPECNSKYIRYFGTGTEKVEEMALQAFPNAKIDRLDLDTSQKRGSIDRIIGRFAKGKTDILIGTQLVAKGLDFANVGLVGIISADISLNIPDYRSPERTFQLITQAAGRAGRGEEAGKVIIQTYTPEHYAIQSASVQDYYSFYKTEIAIRRSLGYPPFSDLIQLIISAEDEELTKDSSEKIKEVFLKRVGAKHKGYILGPRPAPMNKIKELYRYQMLIKCFPEHWELYKEALKDIKTMVVKSKRKVYFSIDVNPYGFL